MTPSASGYYRWRVAVAGTPTAIPVAACEAVTTVNAVPLVSVNITHAQIPPGNATVEVALSRLPRYPAVDMTLNVWGPYASQQAVTAGSCAGNLKVSVDQPMNGDATVTLSPYVGQTGWYAVQATVPPGELRESGQSSCGALGTVLHVS